MPRDFPRSRRIEDQIQRVLSDVMRNDLGDPRFNGAFITSVRVSRDLSVAKVYYSTIQADGDPIDLGDAFASALGFLRSRLAKELTVRRVPELRFERDDTTSNALAMDRLIRDARARDSDTQQGDSDGGNDD